MKSLNDLGFELDEVRLEPEEASDDAVRVKVAVGGRTFHADQMRALTGLSLGEGQAAVLVSDLRSYHQWLESEQGRPIAEDLAARKWVVDVLTPMSERAHAALGHRGDPTQAYCDLLEVRWLMSEAAGHDVGDDAALRSLAERSVPDGSAANMSFVDTPTSELPNIDAELLDDRD